MKDTNDFLQQHKDNYRKILKDIIENNTNALIDEDIKSLLKKPPLDSMDLVKGRLISSAKKNKIVLNTDNLKNSIDSYRNAILECLSIIKKLRNDSLFIVIDKYDLVKETDTIKINKKDFNELNKKIKNTLKETFNTSLELLLNNIDAIFPSNIDNDIKNKIIEDFSKFMKGKYQKQLLENIDIKILIKDTTIINGIKEQGERYIFTLNNSRLLNDNK